jgi:hypothetical protein
MIEHRFQCPCCWEEISMVLDVSEVGEQSYVEDCEVCCRPLLIRYATGEDEVGEEKVAGFSVEAS